MDKNKDLFMLLFGEDGASGLLGDFRNNEVFDKTLADEALNYVADLIEQTKNTPEFPSDDIAALCDMFTVTSALFCDTNNKDVGEFLEKMNILAQGWANE